MIRLEGVSKRFDDKVAVAGLDLHVAQGSVFGLIGPNGAGKTTTLRMLATLLKPDSGSIEIDGHDVLREVRSARRSIGYMPDRFGAFRGLDCEEYLEFFGRAHGLRGRSLRDRIDAVVALTDLDRLRRESTSSLSTGVRQRLALAKTLLHDPELLILDEPASGLDPRARIEIRSLLRELGRMGKTVVISSHILSDLEEICDEVGLIEKGELVWAGSLERLAAEAEHTTRRTIVEVADADKERALAVIASVDDTEIDEVSGRRIRASVHEGSGNRVLAALIAAEIDVLSFRQEHASLESLFLDKTRGEIS